MNTVIMCGADVHDNSLVCRTAAGRGEAVVKDYPNTLRGRHRMYGDLKKMARQSGCSRIVFAYEASTQGFGLYDECIGQGIECFVLAPTKMRKSRKDRKSKNDNRDAQLILEVLRGYVLAGNELPKVWIPDHETRLDRETVRARLDVGAKLTGVKTQVQTLIKGHRITKPEEAGNSWSKPYRQWLKSLCVDGNWAAMATLIRQIEALEKEIAILDAAVEELSCNARYKEAAPILIKELKGVGMLTAMVFLTEMGDMSRFSNRKKVGAYLGLVPTSNESGESADRKGHITREGSARLRRVLCQASWARVANDPLEREYYERVVQRNPKHKKIAVVAVMRRLGVRMWHIALASQRRTGVFPPPEPNKMMRAAA